MSASLIVIHYHIAQGCGCWVGFEESVLNHPEPLFTKLVLACWLYSKPLTSVVPLVAALAKSSFPCVCLLLVRLAPPAPPGSSLLYNLLPDMLSNLAVDPRLSEEQLRSILAFLISFIDKVRVEGRMGR